MIVYKARKRVFTIYQLKRAGIRQCDLLRVYVSVIVQELYDFSRNKLQQKVSQRFLVNRGVLYDILKV